ncbi:hypothetical protein [Hyalangium rubrum]|uniref:Lipoprotein n=1 Tax=Hyalangium rubrum TaxID=3103134 RepID=A0ABU5H435_9BACT|nr:hypothetical protein [Hyalangium sp. s54d21]MDY7226855.1 hypothetical protein [Hyalangium sp. s54d21]
MSRFFEGRLLACLSAWCFALAQACGPAVVDDERDAPNPQSIEQEVYGGDLGQNLGSPVPQGTGSTCGVSSDYQPSCAYGPSAPDVVYIWKAPWAGTFTLSTLGSSFDTVLEVRPYNNTAQSLGCSDDIGPGVQQSQVEVSLTAGQVVQIIIDSYGTQCGNYKLNITSATCGNGCNTPPSSCYQSTGTCTATGCQYTPKPSGASCSDGNACTTSDRCNGSGRCIALGAVSCNSPPNGCYTTPGLCSPSGGCQYAYRCSAGQSCYNGRCCSGSGGELPSATAEMSQDEGENLYACPVLPQPVH